MRRHPLHAPLVLVLAAVLAAGCDGPVAPTDTPSGADVGDGGAPLDGGVDGGRDAGGSDGGGMDVPSLDGGMDDGGTDDDASDGGEPPDDASELEDVELPDVMLGDAGGIFCGAIDRDCDGVCTNLLEDSDSCGACGHSCYGPQVLGAACEMGLCRITSCTTGRADANGDVADGCEAMQDFTLTAPSAVTVTAGGSASVEVGLERLFGFPYPISVSIVDVPGTVTITSIDNTLASGGTVGISVLPTATAATVSARLVASASIAGITHELPLTITIVTSPVRIDSVELLLGATPLPGNEIPQGAGDFTMRVRGAGLTSALLASLGDSSLALTAVAGGTATDRSWTGTMPHGINVGLRTRSLTLTLSTSSGPATFAAAMVVTAITASVFGDDTTGLGTPIRPLRSLAEVADRAGTGDTLVLFGPGSFVGAAPMIEGERVTVRGVDGPVIDCTGGGSTGLFFENPAVVSGVSFQSCEHGVGMANAGVLLVEGATFDDVEQPLDVPPATTSILRDCRLTSSGELVSESGALNIQRCELDGSGVRSTLGSVSIGNSYIHDVAGTCVALGAISSAHVIFGSDLVNCGGDGVTLAAGASAELGAVRIDGARATGLIVESMAQLGVDDVSVRGSRAGGVILRGASPRLTVAMGGLSVIDGDGIGLLVAPSSGTAELITRGTIVAEAHVGGGVEIRNASGATTTVESGKLELRLNDAFGLRISGGTTTMVGARIDLEGTARGPLGIDIVSGGGTISLSGGTWRLPAGTGLRIAGSATHALSIGDATTRTAIVLTGHPYDFSFAIEDARTGSTPAPFIDVRASFTGSDGLPRAWSASYRATRGSYSGGVTPTDLAAWMVRFQGGLRFVSP